MALSFCNLINLLLESLEINELETKKKLKKKFSNFEDNDINQLYILLVNAEKELDVNYVEKQNPIGKFLGNFIVNPADSKSHTFDRIKKALEEHISKLLLLKSNNKEQVAYEIIKKRLPNETEEIIRSLTEKILKGGNLQNVINAYIESQRKTGNEGIKLLKKEGNLELIEINSFIPTDKEYKHIDGKKTEVCHVLFADTSWCVKFKDYYDDYIKYGPLYLIRENGKPLILGNSKDFDWLDVDDEEPSEQIWNKVTDFIWNSRIIPCIKGIIHQTNQAATRIIKDNMWNVDQKKKLLMYALDEKIEGFTEDLIILKKEKDMQSFMARYGVDIPEIEDIDVKFDSEDAFYQLDSSNLKKMEKKLDNEFEEVYYKMSREEWDELDAEEKIKKDEGMMDIIKDAWFNAYRIGTENKLRKMTINELKDTSNPLFIKIENEVLVCTKVKTVDHWIRDSIKYNKYEVFSDDYNFDVTFDNIDYEFDKESFNNEIYF